MLDSYYAHAILRLSDEAGDTVRLVQRGETVTAGELTAAGQTDEDVEKLVADGALSQEDPAVGEAVDKLLADNGAVNVADGDGAVAGDAAA